MYAAYGAKLIEDIAGKVPPCVHFAVLLTFFNGWCTSARFQEEDRVCWLCFECDGPDRLEHYAACPHQWRTFAKKFRKSVFPMSLPRFLGLYAATVEMKVIHATHMYAVLSAVNSRRAKQIISGPDEAEALVWQGHRTAQVYSKPLQKVYANSWLQ